MTTYYVNSGAAGANTGGSWTDAFLTLAQATAVATTANDVIKIHYTHTETTGSVGISASIAILTVDKDASDAYTPMTSGGITTTGSTNSTLSVGANFTALVAGLYWVSAASGTRFFTFGGGDGSHAVFKDCSFGFSGAGGSSTIRFGGANDAQTFVRVENCNVVFGAAGQRIMCSAKVEMFGGAVTGSASSTGIFDFSTTDPGGLDLLVMGVDLSAMGSSPLVGNSVSGAAKATFAQCKLGTGYTAMETQSHLNRSSVDVYIHDCSSNGTDGFFGYHNALGSLVSDTGIYFTAGSAAQSWKITTTAYATKFTPFETPFFWLYDDSLSAITPYIEILRDGSATAYQDDEVWVDIFAKTTTGSTQSTLYSDRVALFGTPANQAAGAGLGSWTGESGTAWSGKIGLGSSVTPTEPGHVSARVAVGAPSITVYVDPQIRV